MPTPLSRRQVLRGGALAAGGLLLPALLGRRAVARSGSGGGGGRARSVIQLWLWGGPSHLDTFDPKPEAGSAYAGPFLRPADTKVPGLRVHELLPLLAQQADKFALIRSMTHGLNGHETAAYTVLTGRPAGERIAYPSLGAVVAWARTSQPGYASALPPHVVLTEPLGRFDEAGFLGVKARAFATGGDPSAERFLVEGVVAGGLSDAQQRARRDLLRRLDRLARAGPGDPTLDAFVRTEAASYDMILGEGARAFDLSKEPDALRDRYGRTRFGQSCLAARRLVERGVPYVLVHHGGWDTHREHVPAMRRLLPELDRGLSTLLADLADRGLLDSTIVWCGGEFGRTPKIDPEPPWNGGRGHWGQVFSVLVAGGGLRGGQAVGSSDARGETVRTRPVRPADLFATFHHCLGLAPDTRLPHPEGLDTRVLALGRDGRPAGRPIAELVG